MPRSNLYYLIIPLLLLSASIYSIQKPLSQDSLHTILNEATSIQEQVESLLSISKSWLTKNQDSSRFYAELSLKYAMNTNNDTIRAASIQALINAEQMRPNDRGYNYIDSLLNEMEFYVRNSGNNYWISRFHHSKGSRYQKENKLRVAAHHFILSLEIKSHIPEKELIATYTNLGSILCSTNNLEKGMSYLRKGYALNKLHHNYPEVQMIYNIANGFSKCKVYDSAIHYAKSGLPHAKKEQSVIGEILLYGNLGNAYNHLTAPHEALKFIDKGIVLADNIDWQDFLAELYMIKARALSDLQKYNESLQFVERAESIRITDENKWYILSRSYAGLGDLKKAHEYEMRLTAVRDSLYRTSLAKEAMELAEIYENEKKTQQINELQQATAIQALIVQRKNWQLALLAVVLGVILVFGIWLYKWYKNKKEKEQSELNQRFLRSQLNPHFIFNALGVIQQFIRKHGFDKGERYLGAFNKLMRQILEFSRHEFITLEDEKETLINYLEVQKLLHNNNFIYTIKVDDDIEEELIGIPPMFAQPAIENSLEHGFKNSSTGKNKIDIQFSKFDNKTISLTITDNGNGFANNQTNNHNSMSSEINSERIKFLKKYSNKNVFYTTNNIFDRNGETIGAKVEFGLPYKHI